MSIVFLGLGSNLGNRAKNLHQAIELLEKNKIQTLKSSSIIETEPVGGPPQNKYLNAVVMAETTLTPFKLLNLIQTIEKQLGRVRVVANGPRTIDIDILLYDDITFDSPQLTIPHPRMRERDFVMTPLNEIAPNILKELSNARR